MSRALKKKGMASSDEADEPSNTGALPSSPSFRVENKMSTQSLLSAGGSGYGSQYGSSFFSRFSLTDGSGIFVSSLALTIIISATVIVGIVLATAIITLAVMLSSCEQSSALNSADSGFTGHCLSLRLNTELNNAESCTVPSICEEYISQYVFGGQYLTDLEAAVESARQYARELPSSIGEKYTLVLDIDETALSNLLSDKNHRNVKIGNFDDPISFMGNIKEVPMVPVLDLYNELCAADWNVVFVSERPQSAWNKTINSLIAGGYRGWAALILRSEEEALSTVEAFKSNKIKELESQGYKIKVVMGDQWSDLSGSAAGARTFKLPNPVNIDFFHEAEVTLSFGKSILQSKGCW